MCNEVRGMERFVRGGEVFGENYPCKMGLFGFSNVFGFYNVRFWAFVRVAECSVCSVVFVEKMWKNMGESLWEKWGKHCVKARGRRVLHNLRAGFTQKVENCGKISRWFYT